MTYIANVDAGRAIIPGAAANSQRVVRVRDLTAMTGVPGPYLSKLLRLMVVHGLLESHRGPGGGFVLAKPAKFIRFLDIMEAAEFKILPDHCAFGWGACNSANPCPLHPAWMRLTESLCDWAARMTLADVSLEAGLPLPADIEAGLATSPLRTLATDLAAPSPVKQRGRKPRQTQAN